MPSIGPRKEHRPGQAKPLAYLLGALLVVGLLGLNVLYSAQTVALDIDFYGNRLGGFRRTFQG